MAQPDDGPIGHQPRQFSHVQAATRKEVLDLDEDKFQETFTLYYACIDKFIKVTLKCQGIRPGFTLLNHQKNFREIV
jgi:hypothetical protein